MEKLRKQLEEWLNLLDDSEDIQDSLKTIESNYPFNKFEFVISHLLATKKLNLDEYKEIREDYLNRNKYLRVFEISAPRGFGESWAQKELQKLVPNLEKPSKKLDANYSGQYDFILSPNIKIEVKASRAVEFESDAPLYIKALSTDSDKRFDMNVQQIKPACCDVFVWLAVWRDAIKCWVLSSFEVENDKYFSKGQHRGNIGEGQLYLNEKNIKEFDKYLSLLNKIEENIRQAFEREKKFRKIKK